MNLLNKTIIQYLFISIPLLLVAGFFSYMILQSELKDGVDENLEREKLNVQKLIEGLKEPANTNLSYDSLSFIKVINANIINTDVYCDTNIFDVRENEFRNYRVLKSIYRFKDINYQITLTRTTQEEEELMAGLFFAFAIIIVFILLSFVVINWLLSKKLWKPFYNTLEKLEVYDLKNHIPENFVSSKTTEFNSLNLALNKMTHKIYSDFLLQKEFTENASHEMQTPLAVIKANISLLMQSPNIKADEMDRIQAIDDTTKKMTSLNKALLLLAKIENHQFNETTLINIPVIVNNTLLHFEDLIEAREIHIENTVSNAITFTMNTALADILITNLIQNAIRHNTKGGIITIETKDNNLIISNTGEPLSMSENELFTRFKKNEASMDSVGLGLAIVKSICALYAIEIKYTAHYARHNFTLKFTH